MEQPWNQQREGGGFAIAESYHADLDQAVTGVCEVVGALLMEDLPASSDLLLDGDVDHRQLSHVIRSLEAEIGGDEPAVMMADDGGEGLERIEDVFSDDMDGYDYEGASSFLAGHDEAEGWCVYTNNGYEGGGVLGCDTTVDHLYYYCCCAEGSADYMYLPLWE
ncbi:unnamed protein product [Miscanthus lutarioriparius]|uniref:Uncharacterized protein n=1 Tax=Miscanthus lutarioriparius TaxID=422564 RepID=A0A811PNN4_9POAL|nr:unnamed protein product [Miscanthus lutarioriparius]